MKFVASALALAMATQAVAAPYPRAISKAEREAVRLKVVNSLKDPASAQFRWEPKLRDETIYCGFVNSKNSYGGYVGFSQFQAFFNDDRSVLVVMIADAEDTPMTRTVASGCAEHGYVADPGSSNLQGG